MRVIPFLLFFVFVLGGCKPESTSLPVHLAQAYGVDSFTKVNSLEFVFHVQKGEKKVARHWKWFPKEKRVIAYGADGDVSYYQNSKMTEKEKAIDAKFVNDSYWLLFPFQVKWDRSNLLTFVKEDVKTPIGQQPATMLTVQ